MEIDREDHLHIPKNNQCAEKALERLNGQTKLTKGELQTQLKGSNKILIMSQFQAEDLLLQLLQPSRNCLMKFPDFKMSVIEQNLALRQRKTKMLLLKKNLSLYEASLKKQRSLLAQRRTPSCARV